MSVEVIYDMPNETYHALPRLSTTGIKKLLVSAQDFWHWSFFNKDRKPKSKDAFNTGHAYESAIIDGIQAFTSRYAPEFNRADHPTALDTMDDIKQAITALGGQPKGTKKADIIAQLSYLDPGAKFVSLLVEQHAGLHAGKTLIDPAEYQEILKAAKRIHATPSLSRYFTDGKAQVSILWDDPETNVPMKARFDYMKDGQINDLKTFSNSKEIDIHRLTASHIFTYGYYIQQAVYRDAYKLAFGADAGWNFVFTQTGGPNNTIVRPFPETLLLADKGRKLAREGINKFEAMFRKFGTAEWLEEYPIADTQDTDFPIYVYE